MKAVIDFIFLGSKITAAGECSHNIKRRLLLGRKAVTNLDHVLKSKDITFQTKVLCCPLLLFSSIFPSIRVFSSELAFCIRWPKYWSFSLASVLPMNSQDWFSLRLTGLISLLSKGFSRVFSNTTIRNHQFFSVQPSLWSNSNIHIWLLEKHTASQHARVFKTVGSFFLYFSPYL